MMHWNFKKEEIKVNIELKGSWMFVEVCNISTNFSTLEMYNL